MKKVLLSAIFLVGGVAVMSAQSVKGAETAQAKVKTKKQTTTAQQNARPVKMVDVNNKQAKADARAKEEGKAVAEPTARKAKP